MNKTAIYLGRCKIENWPMYNQYFDFAELYDFLKSPDAYLFTEFISPSGSGKAALPVTGITLKLVGIRNARGEVNTGTKVLDWLQDPELCLRHDKLVLRGSQSGACIRIDTAKLLEELEWGYEALLYETMKEFQSMLPGKKEFIDAISEVLDEVTQQGKRDFTCEAAVELYLYFLLHMQAGILPNTGVSLARLRRDLNRLCPITQKQLSEERDLELFLPADAQDQTVVLPFYTGNLPVGALEVVQLHNPYQDRALRVVIGTTTLERTLPPDSRIYALRKGGQYVSFLPRFSLDEDVLVRMESGRLCTFWQEHPEFIQTDIKDPVCWSRSAVCGWLLTDREGKLDEKIGWPDTVPKLPVISVSAFGEDYCMLLSDGSVLAAFPKNAWTDTLSVFLRLNAAIAINSRRVPILEDGRKISDVKAVAAYAEEGHYICIDTEGRVHTDVPLERQETAYAASICGQGYVLATKSAILRYSFSGKCDQQWNIPDVTELTASDRAIAYWEPGSGTVKKLEL